LPDTLRADCYRTSASRANASKPTWMRALQAVMDALLALGYKSD
jgi:hypothetical protein